MVDCFIIFIEKLSPKCELISSKMVPDICDKLKNHVTDKILQLLYSTVSKLKLCRSLGSGSTFYEVVKSPLRSGHRIFLADSGPEGHEKR